MCACSLRGGSPGGQNCNIHLTLHVGPRLQWDYQASSLAMLRSRLLCYVTITKPYCICSTIQAWLFWEKMYMWQSRIEIEYYSIAYFECIAVFDVL